jgi:hypothetical protein
MRDTTICFRTSDDLRNELERISTSERRSLSSLIENILYDYVGLKEPIRLDEEKRRYPRKKVSVPALVTGPDGTVHAGVVNDVSLGGLNFFVPDSFDQEMGEEFKISIVFSLPQSERPLTFQCVPRHVSSDGQTNIGASLVNADFQTYRILENYLSE